MRTAQSKHTALHRARLCCALLLLIVVNSAVAQTDEVKACFDLRSNAEQRDCVQKLYRGIAAELERVFQDELARVSQPPGEGIKFGAADPVKLADALTKSQSAWQAYRDAECWGVVGSGGGTGSATWAFVCLIEKTKERMRELTVPIEKGR